MSKGWAEQLANDLKKKHGPEHKAKIAYFAGCTASYVEHDIAQATVRLLDEAGVDTVVTSCSACDMMWRNVYPEWAEKLGMEYDIKGIHYSEILASKIKAGEFSFPARGAEPVTVTWHDSCHIGRVSGVYEPPRDLIKAIPNVNFVEMTHHHDAAHCCGSVLTLIKDPPIAADEALAVGANKVLALCPCCEVQLRISSDKRDKPVEVIDLAHFAASALGYDFPDPNP